MIALAAVLGCLFILGVFALALAVFALADALAHQARDDRAMLRLVATDRKNERACRLSDGR